MSRPGLQVIDRRPLTRPVPGEYQAFPTITPLGGGQLAAAFRVGRTGSAWRRQAGDHGGRGDVYVSLSEDDGHTFGPARLIVSHAEEGTNEHDALITALGPAGVLLLTRSHGPGRFQSFWSLSQDKGRTFPPRQPLDLDGLYLTFYGHALAAADGEGWLLSCYATRDGVQRPGLVRFWPDGRPLELAGWLTGGPVKGGWLNETALARLADGRLLALSRQEPVNDGLFVCFSDDDGATWSEPAPTGLWGEAPNLSALPDGRLLVVFRRLRRLWQAERPLGVGLAVSADNGLTWSKRPDVAQYSGGRYHGGYGDVCLNQAGQAVAVYYLCQPEGAPYVEVCRFLPPD